MSRRYRRYLESSGVKMVPINSTDQTACSVLDHMRTMVKTQNYSGLAADIETLQDMYSRMESALYFYSDIGYSEQELQGLDTDRKKLKNEIKELKAKRWLLKRGKHTEPDTKEQSEYNKGYEAGVAASKPKPEKEDN